MISILFHERYTLKSYEFIILTCPQPKVPPRWIQGARASRYPWWRACSRCWTLTSENSSAPPSWPLTSDPLNLLLLIPNYDWQFNSVWTLKKISTLWQKVWKLPNCSNKSKANQCKNGRSIGFAASYLHGQGIKFDMDVLLKKTNGEYILLTNRQ